MIIIIQVLFIFFLSMSILREIKKLDFIWDKLPLFMQFIPTWSFFAPVPNMLDYHLFYRKISDNSDNKKVFDWEPIYIPKDNRSFVSFFWNPEKRLTKAVLDIAMDLIRFSNKIKDKNEIILSIPYLQLLNYLDSICNESDKLQFMIMTDSREHNYQVAFLSDVHQVRKR